MNQSNQDLDGLSQIETLLDEGKALDAANAYEQWVYQFEHRVVDVGGSAHTKQQVRRHRRRKSKRQR